MSSVQPHQSSEISTVATTENKVEIQEKILEDHSSFTDLKESGNMQSETTDIKQNGQFINRIALSSREELISISETYNGHVAQFQSADTIFTEEEREAQKVEKNEFDEIKSTEKKSEQSSSDKQSIKIEHNQQHTQYINLRNDGTSLTQTAPFQFLQESNIQVKSNNQHTQNMDNLFTQVHTQQIAIQHSTCKSIQNNSQAVQVDKNFQESNKLINVNQDLQNLPKSKFKIMKTLEQSHIPKSQSQIPPNIPAIPQQAVASNVPKQVATSSQISKQQLPKKEAQPFKLQSLYITQLRANSVVKPPQSSAQKKPKIWQTFKNKRQTRQAAAAAQALSEPLKSTESLNNIPQVVIVETKPLLQSLDSQKKQNITGLQALAQPNKIEPTQKTQATIESKPLQSELTETKIDKQPLNLPANQQKKVIHKPLFEDEQKNNDVIQFHHAQHHPLQRINQQLPISKPEPQIQDKQQQPSIPIQSSIKGELQQQQNKVDAPQQQKEQKQIQQQKQYHYEIQSQSEASPSQKEQIIIDYTHNKKYQEELQKANKQKIKSLELKLKYQEEINRQLQKSHSLPIKFLTSAAVGLSTAGIAWAAKKNKNISILLGVATTLATFVFSY